jgi:hypothetical protein
MNRSPSLFAVRHQLFEQRASFAVRPAADFIIIIAEPNFWYRQAHR